ncbi:MAG TPA: THUMP domain-containing protein [Nitrospiraceae bacterium]|nr:THUMP domain-containing protein [Nitrospiraceae bacterium]
MTSGRSEVRTADKEEPESLRAWNVVVTAKDHEQRHLARLVKRLGDFWWTPFLGVLVGRVEDHEAFCDQLRRYEEDKPGFLHPLARLIPIDRTFLVDIETLAARLGQAALTYADRIDNGSFYVRIERRGHAGAIHCQPLEQELDRRLMEHLQKQGAAPRIDFKDPDAIVAVELIGDEGGIGLITRTMRERFPFVKVP